jgi:sulfur carrier protein|tara:strand:+ start:1304 stop:1552 length:249 start_codon:yes stop_codon:yes gene_type:complete
MYRENTNTQFSFREHKRKLNINGSMYLFNSSFTILELMDYLGFNKNVIVIDYNGIILQKTLWGKTNIQTGDSLEILSIAGGG